MPSGDYWAGEAYKLEKEINGLELEKKILTEMLDDAMLIITSQWSEQMPPITKEMRTWWEERKLEKIGSPNGVK